MQAAVSDAARCTGPSLLGGYTGAKKHEMEKTYEVIGSSPSKQGRIVLTLQDPAPLPDPL